MMREAVPLPDPGWYSDPENAAHERWWDGLAWTGHTRIAPSPEEEGGRIAREREPIAFRPDRDTRWVSLIGWSPMWASLLALGWSFSGGGGAAIVLGYAVVVLFAVLDRRELRSRGVWRTSSPLWALLGPLGYLLARRQTVGREDRGALGALIAISVIIAAFAGIYTAITMGFEALSDLQSERG